MGEEEGLSVVEEQKEEKAEGTTPNGATPNVHEPEMAAEPGAATTADGDEKEEDSKQKEAEWTDFPLDISMQIEALYCQWQSDLRKPGQLVEIAVDGQFQEKLKRKKKKDEQRKEGEGGGNKEDLKNNIF